MGLRQKKFTLMRSGLFFCSCLVSIILFTTSSGKAFIFDTFGDGFWKIESQGNGNALVVNSSGASKAVATNTAFQQQFEVLYNEADGTFRLRNHDSWLCIGALNGATSNGTPVVTVPVYTGAASQKWNLVAASSGYQIENVASGLALQTDNGSPAHVTLTTPSTSFYQHWNLVFQTHYPKKGLAGWDSQLPRFNASWLYNWGWTTGESLAESQVFAPMQWGNWGVGTLDNVTEKPFEVLSFNEPDNAGQSDMTVAQAMALWPSLQALNLPLVSPAPQNLFGGWLSSFYSEVASNGYRVDYTAIHEYPESTSASGLMSSLYSAWTTWGRAVWLTEFSVVNWDGTGTWTEEDNYRFLAEFMWQAEGGGNEWLKRYSLFLFSGAPPTNPWDGTGPTSTTFLSDNYTLTPMGELYAGWDADLTLHTNTPYFIHNCATCFRMASLRDVNGPVAVSIRFEDATTQWIFTNAPDGNFYIQSLADGRRLRYSGTTLDLAPPATTGSVVEWSFNGPDSNGYYFMDNYNDTVSLSGGGSGGGINFSAVASGSPSDNTRWRFVKPYYPMSLATAAAPSNLVASVANRSVTLYWSGSAPRYNVYRALASTGPFARVVADITTPYYTDNTAGNGVTYYYEVTSLDSLEDESTNSTLMSATPASGVGQGLVAQYKFENAVEDTSGNGFNGTLSPQGLTTYAAGPVDNFAINFSGGDDSFVTIPNPVGNNFSLAFWVNTTATGGTGQWWAGDGLVDGDNPGTTNDFGVALVGSKVGFGVGNPDTTITSTKVVNDGSWHHVVATRSGTTGIYQLYVDGVLQATASGSTPTRSAPVTLDIGKIHSGGGYFSGSIDDVRIYNDVISPATIALLAGNGSTLVANYAFATNALDSSGFGNNGTTNGDVTFVPGNGGGTAAQFDGVSSDVQIPVSILNNFSIAYWVKTTATAATGQWWAGQGIVDAEVAGVTNDFGTSLVGAHAAFGIGNPDTTIVSTRAINDGNWHLIVATRNGSSGAMKLYVDGEQLASATGPTGPRNAPPSLRVGGIQAGYAGGFFKGAVANVQLFNYQLSGSQVAALYAPQPLPSPWTNTDIGNPASPGYANDTGSIWTLGGGGADIWNTADQFQFAYQDFTGNGILQARLTSGAITSDGTTNANAKAGIMFRDSLTANAPFVMLEHDQSQGLQFVYRDTSGAAAGQQGVNITTNPAVWLRLVRSNDTFYAYYSPLAIAPSAANWILIGSHTTVINSSAAAGLVTCSHNNSLLANASFTGVSLTAPMPPTISSIASQTIAQNTSTPTLLVTVGDALVPANDLVLTASSSDTNLIPDSASNIELSGNGTFRYVEIVPATNQSGAASITLVVNNGQPTLNTATNAFLVNVTTTSAGAWRQQFFGSTANTGSAADDADPANDGIVNIMKRFFGLNPLVAAPPSAWPYPLMEGTNFTYNYTYSLLATDLSWQVEWSPNLMNWSTNDITDTAVSTNGTTEQREASVPAQTSNPLFMQLQVFGP